MIDFILYILVMFYLLCFSKRCIKAFKGKSEAVTPSYRVYFDKLGNITLAKCKKTGKFVRSDLAFNELQNYWI